MDGDTYRGVPIPDKLWGTLDAWKHSVDAMLDRTEPDTSMSPDVASVILRMAVTLTEEDRGASSTSLTFTEGAAEVDEDAVIRAAADIVGRDRIKDRDLLDYLAEIDGREAQGSKEGRD